MSKTFKSHLGNSFTDFNGDKCESWQMVCNETGTAFATLELVAGKVVRFMAADSVSVIAAKWRDEVIALSKTLYWRDGQPMIQFKIGESIQPNDWYCVFGHLRQSWHQSETFSHGKPLREFHQHHFRPLV